MHRSAWAAVALLIAAVCGLYSTHFQNGFHFDDWHTVTGNPSIRTLDNLPRFFTDPSTMSVLPANQVYRPLLPLSLAVDYRIGGGLEPWAFHATTFTAFLALLVLVLFWYRRLIPEPWVAVGATGLFVLHPVAAETVNYVCQRSDLWVALLTVAGLMAFTHPTAPLRWLWPLPVAAAWLFKPTAIMFAPLLVAWLMLRPAPVSFPSALRSSAPAWVLSAAMAGLHWLVTPAAYKPGAVAAAPYWFTQPRVALHYVFNFLVPVHLSADTDRRAFASPWEDGAILGYLFLAALVVLAWRSARNAELRPFAFGLWWFLLALLPVSLTPLAEVENDHRLFAPMIGLSLSVATGLHWLWIRRPARVPAFAAAAAVGIAFAGLAAATWERNQVWRSEATLWSDVVRKSPRNGRGWMNYGLTQMAAGNTQASLQSFTTAREFNPDYSFLEINTGIALAALGRGPEAESHFRRARALAPADALPAFYYARWLLSQQRPPEARALLLEALRLDPKNQEARDLLGRAEAEFAKAATEPTPPVPATPEAWLDQSLRHHRAGRFDLSLQAAQQALKLRPNYAEAYNNIAAAHEELGRWDDAIAAAEAALRIRPDYELARNNLLYSKSRKAAASKRP